MAGYTIIFTDIKSIEVVSEEHRKKSSVKYCYELPEGLTPSKLNVLHVLFFDQKGSKKSIVEQFDEYIWNRVFFYEEGFGFRFDAVVVVTTSEVLPKLYQDFKEFLDDDCCPLILADQKTNEKIQLAIEVPLQQSKTCEINTNLN